MIWELVDEVPNWRWKTVVEFFNELAISMVGKGTPWTCELMMVAEFMKFVILVIVFIELRVGDSEGV